jgi:hypothetical protein
MTCLKRRARLSAAGRVGFLLVIVTTALAWPPDRQPIQAAQPPKLSAHAPQSPRFTSIQLSGPTRIDMKRAGVRGDGVTDDSARIQSIINQAPDNTSFYFPAGVYRLANVIVADRSRLEFSGAGADSILRWSGLGLPRSYTPMMTFRGVTDLLIRDLAFDNRSITTYGGMVFYAAKRVEIKNTSFTDSMPRKPSGTDRYAYVFADGRTPHQDLKIHDNVITNLQLEVDHAERVEIRDNTVIRGTQTAGIGLFSVRSGTVAHDYLIEGNLVIDPEPPASAIAVHLDPPTDNQSSFRRIRIANNSVVLKTAGTVGISLGTPYTPGQTRGNVFQDVVIEDNVIRVHPSAPATAELIRALSNGNFFFSRLVVRRNILLGHGHLAANVDGTVQIRYPQDGSVIAANVLRRAVNGLAVVAAQGTDIADNAVESVSGPAYIYSDSRGHNVFRANYFLGSVSNPVSQREAPHPTDVTEPAAPARPRAGPIISQVQVSTIDTTSARITWQTDKPATSEAEYSTDLSYDRTTHARPPFVQRHELRVIDLQPGTSYNVRVRSIDASGSEAISENARFTTRTSNGQTR